MMALGMVLAPVMVPVMVPVPGQGDRETPLVGDGRRVRGSGGWVGRGAIERGDGVGRPARLAERGCRGSPPAAGTALGAVGLRRSGGAGGHPLPGERGLRAGSSPAIRIME